MLSRHRPPPPAILHSRKGSPVHFASEEDKQRARAARRVADRDHNLDALPHWADLVDRLDPERAALVWIPDMGERRSWTGAELRKRVGTVRAFLAHRGIGPGDRLSILSPNHDAVVALYLGAWCQGVAVVPLNAGEDDDRLRTILENAEPRALFVHARYAERATRILGDRALPLITIADDQDPALLETVLSTSSEIPPAHGAPEHEALVVYTSGTTGHPKGVVLSQHQLYTDARAIAEAHGMVAGDPMLCVLPLHHVNGIVVTLLTPLAYGGTMVLMERFHSDRFFSVIAAEGVVAASVVPTLLQFLLHADPSLRLPPRPTLRHIICGAGPLTCELAGAFEDAFGIPILHGYGLSETTCYSCFLPTDLDSRSRRRWLVDAGFPSIGTPLPCNEMGIMNEEGELVPPGIRGEIVIRGWNVMDHYHRNPEANATAFRHGWFHSGDEGYYERDEKGRPLFFITGRLKELIIRGGVNLAPLEIDEVLASCPGVKAGIAVGFDNDWYGEEVGAVVIPARPDLTPDQVRDWCAQRLPFMKTPKVVVFAESLPVTSTGKYLRIKARPLFAEWKSVQYARPKTKSADTTTSTDKTTTADPEGGSAV